VRGSGLKIGAMGAGMFNKGRICHVMSGQDTSDRALQYDVDVDIEILVAANDFCAFCAGFNSGDVIL